MTFLFNHQHSLGRAVERLCVLRWEHGDGEFADNH